MVSLEEQIKKRREEMGLEMGSEIVRDPMRGLDERVAERQRLLEKGVIEMEPRTMDAQARQEFLAQQVGQENLAAPGLTDLGNRFNIGLSDTFTEKKTKFIEKYPEGEFIEVFEPRTDPSDKSSTILFRRHPNEAYAELDARMIDRWEVLADMADISGEIPSIALEAAFVRGGKLVTQLWKTAASTAGGDVLKEAVEEVRGYQEESLPDVLRRTAQRSAISTMGAGATIAVTGPLNAVRGASSIKIAASAPAAQRAAAKLKVPGLLASQIGRSPLIRKMGGQAGAVLSTISDYINYQQGALVRSLSRLRAKDLAMIMREEVQTVHEQARRQIVKAAQLTPTKNLTEGGTAIQEGLAEYNELAEMLVNRSYQRARLIESPQFDIASAKATAKDIIAGIRGVSEEGGEIALSKQSQELMELAAKIDGLDPSIPSTEMPDGRVVDAVDQLRAIRSQLWDMKTPPPGQIARQPEKDAGKLYAAITHVMRNPKNANMEFVNAWRSADAIASGRFDTFEKLIVVQSGKTETPAMLADRLIKPNQVDNLRILRDSMPDSRWREFQEAVKSDLIAEGKVDNLTKRLDTFDRSTLDALLSKPDQIAFREVGEQIDRLNDVGVKQALQRQTQRAALLSEWIDGGQTTKIAGLLKLTDENPVLRDSIRAGIMERVYNNSVNVVEGVKTINRSALQNEIRTLRGSGALKFLKFNDLRTLKEIDTILEFIPDRPDSGTSLQAGAAVAGIRGFSGDALRTIVEHIGTGRLLTSETFQRILLGTGGKRLQFNSVRVLGSVLARFATDLEKEEE